MGLVIEGLRVLGATALILLGWYIFTHAEEIRDKYWP